MAIFRQYIAPFIIVLIFLVALLAVSSRIFLPADMAAPAPIEEVGQQPTTQPAEAVAKLPLSLEMLIDGLPDELGLEASL